MPTVAFAWNNTVRQGATTLVASSEDAGSPVRYLRDQMVSKTWRSKVGWTVVSGVNDKLDFNDGSVKAATITAGTYSTPASFATAVQTALNAVGSSFVVSYSANKFTITHTGAVTLKWATGTNAAKSCGKDLGFNTAADSASGTSFTSDDSVYQSRQYIRIEPAASLAVQAVIMTGHNVSASAVVKLQGDDASITGGLDATYPVSQSLTASTDVEYYAKSLTATRAYWRLVIDDHGNSDGYVEIGALFLGPITGPARDISAGIVEQRDELSVVLMADSGAQMVDERTGRRAWSFKLTMVPSADKDALTTMAKTVKVGVNWWLIFDTTAIANNTVYGFLASPLAFGHVPAQSKRYDVPFTFVEALG